MGNTFGHLFRITTWGESHGDAVGVVIDGCHHEQHAQPQIKEVAVGERAKGVTPPALRRRLTCVRPFFGASGLGTGGGVTPSVRYTTGISSFYG